MNNVTMSGPLFDGRAVAALKAFEDQAEKTVAQRSEAEIQARLSSVLKHPTGHYQSTIHVAAGNDGQNVLDGTVYGPWLEGVGSRNRTTRFKGYHTFRLIAQKMQAQADQIAQTVLPAYLRRMQ